MPATHVALLRGINVGGKNKLPMKDLIAMFEAAGCKNVANYIQSGNIMFTASASVLKKVPASVSAAIEKQFGFSSRVVIRSLDEIRQVARNNPFLPGANPDLLAVFFLADPPHPEAIAKLDPQRSPPDEYRVVGNEIYLNIVSGMADTKLTNAYFDSKLKTICTNRNWRTVLKLVELMEA